MIGANLRITLADETFVAPITPRVAIDFERHFKMGLVKALANEQKMEHMFWLGWASVKATGRVVKPFDSWLDEVLNVQFIGAGNDEAFEGKE